MAISTKFPFVLFCLLFLAVCTVATVKERGEEAAKEVGSHFLREVGHKIWEYFGSGEFLDDLSDFADGATDIAIGGAQLLLGNM